MRYSHRLLIALVIILCAAGLSAQTTGSLTGRATMEGNPLPGVSVSISSPKLQGTRSDATDVNGNFNFGALPPGQYTVTFEMQGLQSTTARAHVGVGQTARADSAMRATTRGRNSLSSEAAARPTTSRTVPGGSTSTTLPSSARRCSVATAATKNATTTIST